MESLKKWATEEVRRPSYAARLRNCRFSLYRRIDGDIHKTIWQSDEALP